MSILEWVGITFIMVGLFVGLLYAFKFTDSKNNDVKNSYNNDNDYDDDIY